MDSLGTWRIHARGARATVLHVIDLLRDYGPLLRMPHARPIGGLWELRAGVGCVFYFAFTGRRFVLLHAYRKQSQKTPRQELETARRCMADYEEEPMKPLMYEEVKEELLRDPETKAAYDALEPVYQLVRLRIERGLTQRQLAERVGTTQSSIARLENWHSVPSLRFLRRVAEALDAKVVVSIEPK